MCSKTIACLSVSVAIAGSLLCLPGVALAASGTWIENDSNSWDDANTTPWSGGIVADGAGNTADFSTIDITADRTVSLGAPRTIGTIIFGDTDPGLVTPASWTINNNGTPANTLTLSGITVNAMGPRKGATISADIALTSGTNALSVAAGSYLNLAGSIGAGGNTTLQKTGPGVLNITGQYFSAGSASPSRGIEINGGSLIFSNATAYPNASYYAISSNGSGAGTGDRCLVMDHSTVEIRGTDVYIWLQTTGNATSSMDMRGGSLTFNDPVGESRGWWTGILMGAYANGSGNQSIVTIDNDAVLNLNNHAFILTGDNQAQSLGAERVVLRSGAINIPNNTAGEHGGICMGIHSGENVFDQLGGTVYYPSNFGTAFNDTYVGALTLQWRMGVADNYSCQYNLVGGTLTVGNVLTGDGTGPSASYSSRAYFNFHGGTLKTAADETNFFKTTITGTPTASPLAPHAVVWSEGAIIDTNGKNVTIQQPLVAPDGSGVYGDDSRNLTVPLANGGSGYQATPMVRIGSGISGNTATAVANMVPDAPGSTTFKIESITITNPGTNFGAAPAVTIQGGTPTSPATPPVLTTAANVSGGLTKRGLGTLTLTATNTYTGPTNVEGGTLLVNGTHTVGGTYTVANTAALGGTGTIGSPVIVQDGGHLAPGASPAGTLNVGTAAAPKSVSMDANSVYDWEFDGTAGDLVDIKGDLTLTSGWKVSIVDGGFTPAFGSTYDMFTYTGSFSGSFEGIIDSSPTGWPFALIGQDDTAGAGRIYLVFNRPGDANSDGVVDAADYVAVKQNLGKTGGALWSQGDFNGDKNVDWNDLETLMTNFGAGSGPAPGVTPEPGSVMLLMFGTAALLRRRRR